MRTGSCALSVRFCLVESAEGVGIRSIFYSLTASETSFSTQKMQQPPLTMSAEGSKLLYFASLFR